MGNHGGGRIHDLLESVDGLTFRADNGKGGKMKREYYIVQIGPTAFAHGDGMAGFVAGFGADGAARLDWSKAKKVYRDYLAVQTDGARRFPRILKISVEMKTVTPKKRKCS